MEYSEVLKQLKSQHISIDAHDDIVTLNYAHIDDIHANEHRATMIIVREPYDHFDVLFYAGLAHATKTQRFDTYAEALIAGGEWMKVKVPMTPNPTGEAYTRDLPTKREVNPEPDRADLLQIIERLRAEIRELDAYNNDLATKLWASGGSTPNPTGELDPDRYRADGKIGDAQSNLFGAQTALRDAFHGVFNDHAYQDMLVAQSELEDEYQRRIASLERIVDKLGNEVQSLKDINEELKTF